jgi:hypothetical protein
MVVLIAKVNIPYFKEFDNKLVFQDNTTNTCTFKISDLKFKKLYLYIKEKGDNPYSLMSW